MSVKIKRMSIVAPAGDAERAGALAAQLKRLLRQPVAGGGAVSAQARTTITIQPTDDTSTERLARQIAAELRRKLGALD
ncbi:MAG: hypothetical protein ACLGI6_06245 [Gammaproteobacteria bacterium]